MEGVLYKWTNYLSGECRPPCARCARRRPPPARGRDWDWGATGSPGPPRGYPNLANGAGGGLAWALGQLQGAE